LARSVIDGVKYTALFKEQREVGFFPSSWDLIEKKYIFVLLEIEARFLIGEKVQSLSSQYWKFLGKTYESLQ